MKINFLVIAGAVAALMPIWACDDADVLDLERSELAEEQMIPEDDEIQLPANPGDVGDELSLTVTEALAEADSPDNIDAPWDDSGTEIPAGTCRTNFRQAGPRLCISLNRHNARTYRIAALFCRDRYARVCTYEDLTYLYYRTGLDVTYSPLGA